MAKWLGIGFKNTEWYMHTVNAYRKALQDAHKAYEEALKPYEGAQGSKLYERLQKEADEKLQEAIRSAKGKAAENLDSCLRSMLDNVKGRKYAVPTAENLRLLEGLQMRTNVDREVIEEAEKTLAGDSAALDTLQDIALKNGIHCPIKGARVSKKELLRVVECLQRASNNLLKLDNAIDESDHAARGKAYFQSMPYGNNNPSGARVDRGFIDANSCLAWHGCTDRASEIAPILNGTESK